MVESQREQRRIRCSGCQQHIWLRYFYTDKKPLTAVGIDCPREGCQKLNRVYMPETATGIEVGTEPSPEISSAALSPEVKAPSAAEPPPDGEALDGKTEGKAPEGKAPRKNVYWRPPRF